MDIIISIHKKNWWPPRCTIRHRMTTITADVKHEHTHAPTHTQTNTHTHTQSQCLHTHTHVHTNNKKSLKGLSSDTIKQILRPKHDKQCDLGIALNTSKRTGGAIQTSAQIGQIFNVTFKLCFIAVHVFSDACSSMLTYCPCLNVLLTLQCTSNWTIEQSDMDSKIH